MSSSSTSNDPQNEFELGTLDDLVRHHLWGGYVVDQRTLESLKVRKFELNNDAGGLAIRRTSEPLYRETSPENIEFPPGIAAAYLRANGRAKEEILAETKSFPQLTAETGALRSYEPHDLQFLEMASIRDRFLVRSDPRHVRFELLIWQLVFAFPESRLAIVVTRKDDVRRISRELWCLGVRVSRVSSNRHEHVLPRVSIGTFSDFVHVAHRLTGEDFLGVPNAVEGLGKNMLLPISSAFRSRMIGFLPYNEFAAPNDWDLLRAIFGFDELTIWRHGVAGTPSVSLVRTTAGEANFSGKNIVAVKRQLIWKGRTRNLLVRKLARAAAGEASGNGLPPQLKAALRASETTRVVVLVENCEHAQEVGCFLPGWQLVVTAGDISRVLSCDSFQAIATFRAARSIGLVDVLIRADGGIRVPPFLSNGDLLPRLLVDIDDRQHPELRIRSRNRREAYRKLGWFNVGEDAYMARIDEFLASRPEVQRA